MIVVHRGLDLLFVYAEAGLSPLPLKQFLPPLGPVGIASFLDHQGYTSRVIDARHPHFCPEWFAARVAEYRPRFIGFTVLTDTLHQVGRLIRIARRASPDSRIIVGGAHATICDRAALDDLEADAVVRGEGELACLALVRSDPLQRTPGLTFRRKTKLIRTPEPAPIDLDDLPSPDFRLIDGLSELSYNPAVITGRGCPYRCSFCAACVLGPRIRWRSIDRVMRDVAQAREQLTPGLFIFADDTFCIDPKRTRALCQRLGRAGGGKDFFWYAEGRVDRLGRDPELLRSMRDAGLCFLQIGIESGDERVLAAYRKEIALDDARSLAKACARERIFLHAGFIVGGPFESQETLSRTEQVAAELIEDARGFLQIKVSFLNPLPGTEVYRHPQRFGLRLLDRHLLSSISFDNCVTETEALSREDILRGKQTLLAHLGSLVVEQVHRGDAAFQRYCDEMLREIGACHGTLSLHASGGTPPSQRASWELLISSARSLPQFRLSSEGRWEDLVPIRAPLWGIDGRGRYASDLGDAPLTKKENDLFHLCSGKRTGREIARNLKTSLRKFAPVMATLEERRLIFFRTY